MEEIKIFCLIGHQFLTPKDPFLALIAQHALSAGFVPALLASGPCFAAKMVCSR